MSTRTSAYAVILFYSHSCVGGLSHYHRLAATTLVSYSHKKVPQKKTVAEDIKSVALSFSGGEERIRPILRRLLVSH